MAQYVEIPGVGTVEFPDGMSKEEMADAINRNMQSQTAPTTADRAATLGSGVNKGLSYLGMPVDLAAAGLNLIPGVDIQNPVGGSQWIQNQFRDVGAMGSPQWEASLDRTGRVLNKTGEMIGATLPATGGVLGVAGRTVAPMAQNTSTLRNIGSAIVNPARQAPGRFAAGEAGAAGGAGLGAATANELYPDNPVAETVGMLTGSMAPAATMAGVRGAFRGGDAGRRHLVESLDTFTRAGVDPTAGQASGATRVQGMENILSKAPGGVSVFRKAAERANTQLKNRVEEIASGYGSRSSAEQAGRTIERGIQGFTKRFQRKSEQLYGALDDYIKPDTPVQVNASLKALEKLNAPIKGAEQLSGVLANPKIAQVRQAFMQDAQNGVLPYKAIKDLRSKVGRMLSSSELISEAPKAELKQIYKGLSQDMEAAARAAGPQASKAYSRANTYYKGGLKRIDERLQKLVNKANPEDIFLAATKGKEGASTIRTVRRSLEPDEWDTVASTVLRRMGRAKNAHQDDLGEAFSVETYLTNWNALSPEAKSAMFSGTRYSNLSRNLDDVAKAASKIREASRVLDNPSGTAGQGVNWAAWATGLTGLATGNINIPVGVLAVAGMSSGASKLMTNPKFVRWLANSTEIPMSRLPGYLTRLSVAMKDEDPETIEAAREYLEGFKGDTK